MAAGVTALCGLLVWAVFTGWAEEFPNLTWLRYPIIAGFILTAATFLTASYYAFKLLRYIDAGSTFSLPAVRAIRMVEYCGFIMGTIYAIGLPVTYQVTQHTDAPGLMIIGTAFVGIPWSVAVMAGIIRKLIQSAVVLKAENDLTV